jgi:hypothetical protein
MGEVLPQRHDLWWTLREEDTTAALAQQILLAIEEH